jgi:hypothetical protein
VGSGFPRDPRHRAADALRAINHSLGEGIDPAQIRKFRIQSYCPELQASPPILDLLYETRLWEAAESLIGSGQIRRVGSGQIALRFPSLESAPRPPSPHLDGLYMPGNGVPEGEIGSFSMLMAVFLSALPGPDSGNFTVWPGTHRLYESYFRDNGIDALFRGLSEAMPPIPLPTPIQVLAQPGDAVLCHYQLAHSVAINLSPHVRYAVFFRLSHTQHADHKIAALTDIWTAWPGMADVISLSGQEL